MRTVEKTFTTDRCTLSLGACPELAAAPTDGCVPVAAADNAKMHTIASIGIDRATADRAFFMRLLAFVVDKMVMHGCIDERCLYEGNSS
jgi:hypothetical protein